LWIASGCKRGMRCMEGINEHDCGILSGAVGDIAPGIVAAGVDLPCFIRTGRTAAIYASEFVRLAVAIEVLLGTSVIQRSLPQLAQVTLPAWTRWLCSCKVI